MTFKENKLVELCEIVSSKRVFAASYQSEGVPFFRGKEVSQLARGENTTAELYISNEVYNDVILRTGSINAGDILLTAVGTLGNPYQVKETDLPFYFKDGNIVWLRKFSKEIDSTYLFYWLNSEHGRRKVLDTAIGSTQAALTITGLGSIQVSCPSLRQQTGIVNLLSAIDKKISITRALSKTLEDIAQTIFKSWFIDFDPVKAKMAGEKPAGMDSATAALFPDSMEESELGFIPKGWKAETIGSICESVVNGSTPLRTNSSFWNSNDISWFKTGELSDNFLFESKESISQLALEKTSVKVLPRGSVLMAIYAAPTVGRLGVLTKSASFNQACTGMIAKDEIGMPYLYLTLFNRRTWFNSLAIGAAQQNISKVIVEACPAVIASQEIHNTFLEVIEPIFAQIEALSSQSNSLALFRDSLLPRLISGELQIPEEMLAT